MNEGTIAAISTPQGLGGIAIVRLSGPEAIAIADRVFVSASGKKLQNTPSHRVLYGHVKNGDETVDEVLLMLMRGPKTFTREDVVEFNCHGGPVVTRAVLKTLIASGARLAEPGEFTKRAFLNGRIDLTQAEGIIDLINAKTDRARKLAQTASDGELSQEFFAIRDRLLSISAELLAVVDFPEEEIEETGGMEQVLEEVHQQLTDLCKGYEQGRLIRDGAKVALIGCPNVGKSSVLNCLTQTDRAIVTDIAGTTRDVLTEDLNIDGIPVQLMDTAGIRESEDRIESLGVERSRQALNDADLVLVVLDRSRSLTAEDEALLSVAQTRPHIVIANKTDLPSAWQEEDYQAFSFCAKTGEGRAALLIQLSEKLSGIHRDNTVLLSNARHFEQVTRALASVEQAQNTLQSGMEADLAVIDINAAIEALGEITGETVSEAVTDRIFSQFCLGK